jgi:hypothetical protein
MLRCSKNERRLVNNNENTSARVDADAAGRGEGGTELIEMVEEN